MSLTFERIHEIGAKRHPELWFAANMQAVDAASSQGVSANKEPFKTIIPEVCLRILDGIKVEQGYQWLPLDNCWVKFPRTKRFSIVRDPNRLGIDGKPSRILEVMYHRTPDSEPEEFAHIWIMRGWSPEDEGKWTFNRSTVCIKNEWWPAEYKHDTLESLMQHLEETFVEGVPANQPT